MPRKPTVASLTKKLNVLDKRFVEYRRTNEGIVKAAGLRVQTAIEDAQRAEQAAAEVRESYRKHQELVKGLREAISTKDDLIRDLQLMLARQNGETNELTQAIIKLAKKL